MSVSNVSFSATLPPFYQTSGYNTNFSNTNISATGNVQLSTVQNPDTGQNSTNVSSAIVSNGISFVENAASINGNVLTVNYQSSNAADSAQDSGVAQGLLNANINGGGISFTPQSSTTNNGTVTTSYATSPNSNFNLAIQGAATSTGDSSNGENIVLKSLSLVGNSLTATYQLTNGGLPDNTTLAPHVAPQLTNTVSVSTPSGIDSGSSFSSRGAASISEVLAGSNGFNANGSLVNALQQPGQSLVNDVASPASTLAATINPNINLSPDASLQVADFIDTSPDAFPTSADNSTTLSNAINAYNSANNNAPDTNATGNTSASGASDSSNNYSYNPSPADTGSTQAQTGIYSAIANANASTIRGAGLDTVA